MATTTEYPVSRSGAGDYSQFTGRLVSGSWKSDEGRKARFEGELRFIGSPRQLRYTHSPRR
ncbi:hypothetical protein D3C75_1060490 [compost metagenome]